MPKPWCGSRLITIGPLRERSKEEGEYFPQKPIDFCFACDQWRHIKMEVVEYANCFFTYDDVKTMFIL